MVEYMLGYKERWLQQLSPLKLTILSSQQVSWPRCEMQELCQKIHYFHDHGGGGDDDNTEIYSFFFFF